MAERQSRSDTAPESNPVPALGGAPIWLVNATRDHSALPQICEQAQSVGQIVHVLQYGRDREAILQAVSRGDEMIRFVELAEGGTDFPNVDFGDDAEIIFLPCVDGIDLRELQQRAPLGHPHCIQPLAGTIPRVGPVSYVTRRIDWFGWRARGELARRILREPSAWQENATGLVESIQKWPDPPRWDSIPLVADGSLDQMASAPPRLTMSSSVLAVISFYRCEEWLHACLTSMNQQTRPPENIVVIDDCSPALPLKYLEAFPNVTLLSTTRNVGPERILNNIIHATDYDAYLVQDADDWSSHDRLELSLRAGEQTGADMVGTHEFRIHLLRNALALCVYPPDVNRAMESALSHYILHCTSLISRGLVTKIGGFDEHLNVAADTDFVVRACQAGRIINLPSICLYHRTRAGSLTTHETTGHQSTARLLEDRYIKARGKRNMELARSGKKPNLTVQQKEPVEFIYHQGPKLRQSAGGRHEERPALTWISGM
jgi:hypothetical protein